MFLLLFELCYCNCCTTVVWVCVFTKLLLSLLSLIIALDRIVAGNDAHTFVLAPQRATIG